LKDLTFGIFLKGPQILNIPALSCSGFFTLDSLGEFVTGKIPPNTFIYFIIIKKEFIFSILLTITAGVEKAQTFP
jgi:hypothetical protein